MTSSSSSSSSSSSPVVVIYNAGVSWWCLCLRGFQLDSNRRLLRIKMRPALWNLQELEFSSGSCWRSPSSSAYLSSSHLSTSIPTRPLLLVPTSFLILSHPFIISSSPRPPHRRTPDPICPTLGLVGVRHISVCLLEVVIAVQRDFQHQIMSWSDRWMSEESPRLRPSDLCVSLSVEQTCRSFPHLCVLL